VEFDEENEMNLRWVLGAFLITLALTAWLSTTYAQDGGDGCRSACEEQTQQCMQACGEHRNPMDCEVDCREAGQDCQARCD